MGTTRAGNISPDSETAFNFDRLMHRIFDATQTNDGTFMSAESNRASNEQEKWSIEGVEKEKKEESEKTAALVELGESQREAREEAERARIKAWDEAPSLDYPGLTNAQVLSGLRTICANLPAYTNRAVQNGWIKPEEEDEFAAYMRRELWLKEQQRLGHTNTPEYIAAQHQQDQANQQHPGWHDHAVTLNKEANGLNINIAQDQTHSEVTAAVGGIRTNARIDLFNGVESGADNLRYDSQFHVREQLIRPVSDSNDAKGVLREGDKGLEIIGSPKSVWHENDGNEFNGINKRDFLQSGDDITTGGVNAHGLSASKDFNKAVAVSGVLNPNIDLNPQIPNRPVASITDFRMNDML